MTDRPIGCQILAGYDPTRGAEDAGCWFDAESAKRAMDFFPECLRHIEGSTAGTPFVLQPWQANFVAMLFGWKRKDAMGRIVRRYREVFLMVPRKNGKTPIAAGIALLLFFCDGEPGAQVFCAAADTEQAALLFRHAKGMVESEPELDSRANIFRGTGHRSIVLKSDPGSFFRVLSSDANTKHGGNTHAVLIDELHAQKNRELVDVLGTSMASATRKQPLMINITTADYDRISICNEKHDYARSVRDGVIDNPAFLPVVYECLNTDDWTTPEAWAKANPNLGVSVSLDYMRQECKRAQEIPAYENTFKRLHLNIRTSQDVCLIDMPSWDACPVEVPAEHLLIKSECFAAFDLSSTDDLTSFGIYWPEYNYIRYKHWIPGENVEQRERISRVPFSAWRKAGLLNFTPGNVIDYRYIIKEVVASKAKYPLLRQVAYDPWNATQTSLTLQDEHGFEMVAFRQGFVSMNEPTQAFLGLIRSRKWNTGGSPFMRWQASNASGETDAAGNVKISKRTSKDKIDGLIVGVMCLGLSILRRVESASIYSRGGKVFSVGGAPEPEVPESVIPEWTCPVVYPAPTDNGGWDDLV